MGEDVKNSWTATGCATGWSRSSASWPLSRHSARRRAAGVYLLLWRYATLADCCLVPQIFNGKRFDVNFDGLPRTMAAFDACMALDAFQKAQPSACPDNEA